MNRGTLLAVAALLTLAGAARAQTPEQDADRFAAAQKRLAERAAAAKVAATRPVTKPAGTVNAMPATIPAGKKVVFLIDASGSMISKFDAVRDEVAKAINSMPPDQSFAIITAADSKANVFDKGMVAATEANATRAFKWLLTIKSSAGDGMIEGLDAAAKTRPDVVWMLSDGDFKDNDAVVLKATRVAKAAHLRINVTTLFCQEVDAHAAKVMRTIAARTGGVAVDDQGNKLKPFDLDPRAAADPALPVAPPKGKSILSD